MKRAVAPAYDFFKLIVTLILLAIVMFMMLRSCSTSSAPMVPVTSGESTSTASAGPLQALSTETIAPTATKPTSIPTILPTPTAILTITETAILSPTPDNTAMAVASPTAEIATAACNISMPSRLRVGISAQVLNNLNMRNAPEISAALLQTNLTGTKVEIIDGPICTPRGEAAYLWWKIRLQDGSEGWSAETPLISRLYFLEPLP